MAKTNPKQSKAASDVARNLRRLMHKNDMTQRQLSRMTGITEAAISRYLSNMRCPNLPALIALADAFDVTIDEIVRPSQGSPARSQRI